MHEVIKRPNCIFMPAEEEHDKNESEQWIETKVWKKQGKENFFRKNSLHEEMWDVKLVKGYWRDIVKEKEMEKEIEKEIEKKTRKTKKRKKNAESEGEEEKKHNAINNEEKRWK